MAIHRIQAPVMRRFLSTLAFVAAFAALACRRSGEDITTWLAHAPASDRGWPVIGWLFGGPPLLLAALAWIDRSRFDGQGRRNRATFYAAWFGIGLGFGVPALVSDSAALFGRGVETGNPIVFGWACGAVANLAALAFTLGISRVSRGGDGRARRLAIRFVEVAWVVLVTGSLLFAAYGRELGFNY